MAFVAVQDISYSKESNSTVTMGVYLDNEAGAEAKGQASAQASTGASAGNAGVAANAQGNASASASASGSAEASAKVGVGLQFKTTSNSQEDGSSTALVSSIKSNSGSVSRTATGSIMDVGTNIEAATDFTQSATTIEMLAAENSQFSKTTSEVNIGRIGLYYEADAEAKGQVSASAEATASGGTTAAKGEAKATASASGKAEAGAREGIEMSFDRTTSTDTSKATQAVVSNIKVGGNINSTSSGKTTLQGTNLEAGGGVNLSASELEIQAARDTASQTSTTETVYASLQVYIGVGAEAKAKASASTGDDENTASAEAEAGLQGGVKIAAGYTKDETKDEGTRAVVSNISGSKITINTTGKTSMEGTNLNAGEGGIDVAAKSLDFKAATDTFASSNSSVSFQAELAAKVTIGQSNAEAEGDVSVGVTGSQSSGTNAVVGSLTSAGGLNIRTQDDLRLQGTQINVAGDTNLSAGGNVTVDAAKNTFQASAYSVDVSLGFNSGDKNFNAGVGVGVGSESSSQAVVSNMNTGGSLNISAGKNATFEGANVAAGGDAQVVAMGDVTFKEARNESTSDSVSVDVNVGYGAKEDKNTNGTQSSTSSFNAGLSVDIEITKSSDAVTGSFQAGKSLSVVSGGNTTFVGTDLAAGQGVSVAAGGDVSFKAAESTSSSTTIGVALGIGTSDKTTTNQDPNEKEEEGNVAFLFKDDKKGDTKDAPKEEAPAEDAEPAEGTSKNKSTINL
jgi:filamentous hemagglutinin